MNQRQARANLVQAVQAITDLNWLQYLDAWGFELKRQHPRDHREPGKKEKEQFEDRLAALMRRHWRKQKAAIREKLEWQAPERKELLSPIQDGKLFLVPPIVPERKAIMAPSDIDFDDVFEEDEELIADLIRLLTGASTHGIDLFGQMVEIGMDYTLVNSKAAEWARKYAGDLIKDIDHTTQDVLRNAISAFVETPGFTIRDVMDMLPFSEERSISIAVTEITRSYAEANLIAGQELKREFPDVKIIKMWRTNQDNLVCLICAPLDGMEVEIDEGFSTEEGEGVDGPPIHPNDRCWLEVTTALAELD